MNNVEFAAGLRELAELYERHPEMGAPLGYQTRLTLFASGLKAETARATIAALADGGAVEKVGPKEADDYFYTVRRTLPSGLQVEYKFDRSTVCRKVSKMKMVETWECPDSILDPEAV